MGPWRIADLHRRARRQIVKSRGCGGSSRTRYPEIGDKIARRAAHAWRAHPISWAARHLGPVHPSTTCPKQVEVASLMRRREEDYGSNRRARHTGNWRLASAAHAARSEEHTSELQSRFDLVCR